MLYACLSLNELTIRHDCFRSGIFVKKHQLLSLKAVSTDGGNDSSISNIFTESTSSYKTTKAANVNILTGARELNVLNDKSFPCAEVSSGEKKLWPTRVVLTCPTTYVQLHAACALSYKRTGRARAQSTLASFLYWIRRMTSRPRVYTTAGPKENISEPFIPWL